MNLGNCADALETIAAVEKELVGGDEAGEGEEGDEEEEGEEKVGKVRIVNFVNGLLH